MTIPWALASAGISSLFTGTEAPLPLAPRASRPLSIPFILIFRRLLELCARCGRDARGPSEEVESPQTFAYQSTAKKWQVVPKSTNRCQMKWL